MLNNSKIFVISAPSGTGKTTVIDEVLKIKNLKKTISYTTRLARVGETHGKDYYFITDAEFEEKINNNDFIEFAKVYDHYYGTSLSAVEKSLNNNINLIKDIDTVGALILKNKLKERAILIFLMPPSFEILEERLQNRKTDDLDTIKLRLDNAKVEINNSKYFDYIIVNDDLNVTTKKLCKVIDEYI